MTLILTPSPARLPVGFDRLELSSLLLQPDGNSTSARYTIVATGFPARQDVVVKLIPGLAVDGPVVAVISAADFTTGGQGGVAPSVPLLLQQPLPDAPGQLSQQQRYYLYAYPRAMPALFAFSQPFTISSGDDDG